ncbi:formate dehydrogenase, nitrate-inducible, major subunit [Escherichia coli 4_1_47FAA]|nr:formate dehydrogenase, nitrate-inducible, major subunit [Escherichia coli 4_1_47FAA]
MVSNPVVRLYEQDALRMGKKSSSRMWVRPIV